MWEVEAGVDPVLEGRAVVLPPRDVETPPVALEDASAVVMADPTADAAGWEEGRAEVDCSAESPVDDGAGDVDDSADAAAAVELGVLVSDTIETVTESVVVTDVVVTTVPFPEEPACLFANSIKFSATSAFCRCIASMAVLSSWNTPC